jgi:hypothetical protein
MHVAASQDFQRIAIYSGDALEMLVRNPFSVAGRVVFAMGNAMLVAA